MTDVKQFFTDKCPAFAKLAAMTALALALAPFSFAADIDADEEDDGAAAAAVTGTCSVDKKDICENVSKYVKSVIKGDKKKAMATLASLDNDEVMLEFYLTQKIVPAANSNNFFKATSPFLSAYKAESKSDFERSYSQLNYLLIKKRYEFALVLLNKYGRFINDNKIGDFDESVFLVVALAEKNDNTAFILLRELIKSGAKVNIYELKPLFQDGSNNIQRTMLEYIYKNANLSPEDKNEVLNWIEAYKEKFRKKAIKRITFEDGGIHINNKGKNAKKYESLGNLSDTLKELQK